MDGEISRCIQSECIGGLIDALWGYWKAGVDFTKGFKT